MAKMGYTSDAKELGADEVEWFVACENALNKAREVLTKMRGKRG